MKKKHIAKGLAVLLAVFVCLAFAGCSDSQKETTVPEESTEQTTTKAPETTTAKAETVTTSAQKNTKIGQKTETSASFLLTNRTGGDIVSFVFRSGNEEAGQEENLLSDGDVFADNETRMVFCEFSQANGVEDEILSGDFLIDITLKDGTTFTLHSFPVDITKGELFLEGEIGYLVYKHVNRSETVSTLAAEQSIAKNPEEETTEAPQEEYEPVYEEPYVDPGYDDGGNEEPVYYEEPVDDGGGNEDPGYEDPGVADPGNEDPGSADPGNGEGGNEEGGGGEEVTSEEGQVYDEG